MSTNIIENILPVYDRLLNKVITYYSTIWQDRRGEKIYEEWLSNFKGSSSDDKEKLHALFLLSKFMYFGNIEMRELLKCIYRDLFKYPIVADIRRQNSDIRDIKFIEKEFSNELSQTRFLGVGNPSESGVHLLYYFRQENALGKEYFLNAHEIFKTNIIKETDQNGLDVTRRELKIKNSRIKRYIFIDDFCGSGTQAKEYSNEIVSQIKDIDDTIEVNYLMLFGTEKGIDVIKKETKFDNVDTVFSLDDSFKCFDDSSRYFRKQVESIEKDYCKQMCVKYGEILCYDHPLGYKDSQLMLSLFHNTPDNTLPIFWAECPDWVPVFKRFHKF